MTDPDPKLPRFPLRQHFSGQILLRSNAATECSLESNGLGFSGQPRRMGAPKGAPVSPPSTISSTALMYDESSEARKSTALARSSGSPQRASGTVEDKKSETFADSSAVALARDPRFQMVALSLPR